MDIKQAIDVLRRELDGDLDYRLTWEASISVCIKDRFDKYWRDKRISQPLHDLANDAAKDFIKLLCQKGDE